MTVGGAFKRLTAQWQLRARRFGDAGVGRADEDHAAQAARIRPYLDELLLSRRYDHILDFGAGWGRFTELLESCGSHVWAVDVVPAWLTEVQRRSKTLTAVKLDSPALPIDSGSMDLIVDIMTLQSITDATLLAQCCAELRRVAAPAATVLSLHKADVRSAAILAPQLGLAPGWIAVLTQEIDEAGDLYYFLLGRRAR